MADLNSLLPITPMSVYEDVGMDSLVTSPISLSSLEVSVSTALCENSLDSNDSLLKTVSPSQVPPEHKRKRGRRPKSEAGIYYPPRRRRPRKVKAYEIEKPFEDKEKEKKRLNAISAKCHRDSRKIVEENLRKQIRDLTEESDNLRKEKIELQKNTGKLLELVKNMAAPVCNT